MQHFCTKPPFFSIYVSCFFVFNMDQAAKNKKIDEALEEKQRKDKEFFAKRDAQDALYETTIGIIQAEIEKLLAENYRRIVNVVKQNETTGPYYNGLDDEKKVMLLVRATHKGASEFFQRYEPDFLRSSQENSQENGLHILLQLPKNMQ